MSKKLVVRIGGSDYTGWEDVTVTRAVDQAASTFSLVVADPNAETKSAMSIPPGTKVQVIYGGETLITGYIDTNTVEYAADSHSITLAGRSLTKDIVDCSVIQDHLVEFKNKNIFEIAGTLCGPYNISVRKSPAVTDLKIYPSFKVNDDGESVHAALDRLAQDSQVVLSDSPDGNLLISRIGDQKSGNQIIRQKGTSTKVLACSCTLDESDRYSTVKVVGQRKGDDEHFGKSTQQISSSPITDSEVKRNRFKLIVAQHEMKQSDVEQQAVWYQQGYIGKGTKVTYTLQDWVGNGGGLWRENQLVSINDDMIPVGQGTELMISTITYHLNNSQGTTCELTLNSPNAFAPDPTASSASDSEKSQSPKEKKEKKLAGSKGKKAAKPTDFWQSGDPL